MPMTKLKDYLDANGVRYVTISHSQAYTALEIAASAHIKGKEIAKTVVVKLDGKLAMAVLPGTQKVDLERLRQGAGAVSAELATEGEFLGDFPGCELGAMPPFGNLFGMEVFVDPRLAADAEIAFNAGTHTELVRMAYADLERLVKPKALSM
ncbi:aminoacyl-tRNA deacylase [Holophaga foetida]|uniref:aminoacyl-tRNA deacylase n=1 Tax=Holophaga foetida TaxID=35839 RepID=UPI000247371E|nr:YbaK/EbsC family protein [Holophaga foetida]